MPRPISITVDLDAIRQNFAYANALGVNALESSINDRQSNTLAVIKADAYGHGAVATARALNGQAALLAVSSIEEAVSLRQHHIKTPILLLEGCFCPSELSVVNELNLQIVIHNQKQIEDLLAQVLTKPIKVWLKVDTGMHRLGIPVSDALKAYTQLASSKNVCSVMLMTHFATSDHPDHPLLLSQIQSIQKLAEKVSAEPSYAGCSLANSAALLATPKSISTWNRPGIMLYGISPFNQSDINVLPLIPAMTFSSKVIALRRVATGESVGYGAIWTAKRPSIIATVAAGYGDGYPRTAKSGTPVMVNGQIAPLAGRVSMDMLCVDVTQLTDISEGSPVELWGKNIPVNDVAAWADTLGYELVTRMPTRAKRVFINE
ncbi:alanine racemase [Paraglaciecola sp. T6c]|uniref:Alanine racemase n=1 Tax=Pseudoalteromonas atlantica (strain T6c / ATCC BAA-1087) TaxID=3042615 RepID=ALR_PSEA6|nr:alanine racemase [Paraglaciecola sp. T6c]Q15NL4.1 RecName: Full=Alanine racemase [Paraglaciecola sp. T6c]ABG42524.1 alanine racemase [Paraglaciecola sp. T6c]